MLHIRSWLLSPALVALLVAGCGSEADAVDRFIGRMEPLNVRDSELVGNAARHSDPGWIAIMGSMPAGFMSQEGSADGCPRFVDNSDVTAEIADWRVEGDCTDSESGVRYEGSIVVRGDMNGTEIQYRDFRLIGPSEPLDSPCAGHEGGATLTGVVRLPMLWIPGLEDSEEPPAPDEGGRHDLHILHLIQSVEPDPEGACQDTLTELAYDMTMDAVGGEEYGRFDMDGRVATRERVRATPGEPWIAAGPPASAWSVQASGYGRSGEGGGECYLFMTGTLRLSAGGDVAVLSPNPTDSCYKLEEPLCAPWSLNGNAQPDLVCDFAYGPNGCSAGPDSAPPWLALGIVLAALLWQERRRRRTLRSR